MAGSRAGGKNKGKMGIKKKKKSYAHGGQVKIGIKPTNLKTVKAKGAGAATKGFNFKV